MQKTKKYLLQVNQTEILVTQKRIKNIHLKICVIDGLIKVSAPLYLSQDKIKTFVISKFDWILAAQTKLDGQKKFLEKKYINEENHYFFDKNYSLNLIEITGRPKVLIDENNINLFIKSGANLVEKKKLLEKFYRENLQKIIPNYIKKWEEKMNLRVEKFGIKKMKTRWGTCNIRAKRIWINLELAKKPIACLEYIIVHEMVHLFEKNHNKRFYAYMDQFLPNWRDHESELKLMRA